MYTVIHENTTTALYRLFHVGDQHACTTIHVEHLVIEVCPGAASEEKNCPCHVFLCPYTLSGTETERRVFCVQVRDVLHCVVPWQMLGSLLMSSLGIQGARQAVISDRTYMIWAVDQCV